MAIKIGTNNLKRIYLGTNKAKLVYLGTSLIFADSQTLSISIGTGISSISYTATTVDGKTTSGTIYSTTSLCFGYGTTISFSYVLSTGYQMGSSTSSVIMTSDKSVTFSATPKTYSVYVKLRYGGTSYGSAVGSIQYSTNGSTWTTSYGSTLTLSYGTRLQIRNISAVAGFALSSVQYNGSTVSASGGVYTITVGAGNYYLYVNYAASTVNSSISFAQVESITTNSLSRSAFTVSFNINIKVKECTAGTVIGTVPVNFRPASAKTYTTRWLTQTGTSSTTNDATITINPSGTITSSLDSKGSGSQSGGGKWGSYSISWYTTINISGSWSVR